MGPEMISRTARRTSLPCGTKPKSRSLGSHLKFQDFRQSFFSTSFSSARSDSDRAYSPETFRKLCEIQMKKLALVHSFISTAEPCSARGRFRALAAGKNASKPCRTGNKQYRMLRPQSVRIRLKAALLRPQCPTIEEFHLPLAPALRATEAPVCHRPESLHPVSASLTRA
jgi:hypothetical protein